MKNRNLTIERLKELLKYDPETGLFTRKTSKGGRKAGSVAGTIAKDGYIHICVDETIYNASNLAWFYVEEYWPEHDIDHEDRVKSNNKWINHRHVSRQCNIRNRGMLRSNKSGITGVHWHKTAKKWLSFISVNNKRKHLGSFIDLLGAAKARWEAEKKI